MFDKNTSLRITSNQINMRIRDPASWSVVKKNHKQTDQSVSKTSIQYVNMLATENALIANT